MRVRRLRARRKADRIVTERYHRGGIEAEVAIRCRTAITRGTDLSRLSRLGEPAPQTKQEWRLRCHHGGQKAVRSTDPDQSPWWLLAPARGTVVGATIPYLSTLGLKWAAAYVALNATGGLTVPTPQFRKRISGGFALEDGSKTSRVT